METRKDHQGKALYLNVEREPMWDGNRHSPGSGGIDSVEREPMWDGNGLEASKTFPSIS